ncbi:hypothetical protein DFH06DRAFT_1339118 [Mycena polygramma]|nr:hypothetical protein DFH06DRAFT_1339118 [Mycena polygramma]
MSSTTIDRRPFRRKLARALLKAAFWILLYLPSYISYFLYSREKTALSSPLFWVSTSYGLVSCSGALALMVAAGGLSPSFRLFEPLAIYLTIVINFYRVPEKLEGHQTFYDPHSFEALFWLVVVIPIFLLGLWINGLELVGRPDRVVIVVVDTRYWNRLWNRLLNCRRRSVNDLDLNMDEEHSDPLHIEPADAV